MKKKMKYFLVLLVLLFLSISVVNASDNTTTNTTAHTLEKTTHNTEKVVTSTHEEIIQNDNINNINTTNEKTINKINTAQNTKTAPTEDISNYATLHAKLTSSDSLDVTINIIADITLGGSTTVNSAIKTLTINGKCDKQFSSPL